MATIKDKIKACDYLINNMLTEQERIVYRNEDKIIRLNTRQFDDGIGSDDKQLFNEDPKYTGFYSPNTPNKEAGQLYNFYKTGVFLSGMTLEVRSNLVQLDIFSTGTGNGDKSLFFKGYTSLFGLNKNNEYILNYEIILPELLQWIKKYI